MKNFLFTFLAIGFLLAASFFMGKNYAEKEIINIIDSDTAKVSIDLPLPISEIKPEIVYRDTGTHTIKIEYKDTTIFVPVPVQVDSAAIVADYLILRNYTIDTTINEVKATIQTSVYANKLANMQLSFTNLRTCSTPKSWRFKAGVIIGINDFTPSIALDHKKFSYQAGYDLIGEEKGFRAGLFYDF